MVWYNFVRFVTGVIIGTDIIDVLLALKSALERAPHYRFILL